MSTLHPVLADALGRLDARLLRACELEEHRSTLLAGDGRPGWAGVRNLAAPTVDDLVPSGPVPDALVPGGHPVLDRLRATVLDDVGCDALLVLLAPHVEPRYASLYAVLQDDLDEHRPTERLLMLVLDGADPGRGRVRAALSPGAALLRSGLVRPVPGWFRPLARPLDLPDDVVEALLGAPHPAVPGALRTRWTRGAATGATASAAGEPPVQVLHGAGDVVGAARAAVPPDEDVVVVEVPATPDGAAVCRAAWRVGLCAGARPLLDLRGWAEGDVLPVVAEVGALVQEVGGTAWLGTRQPVPLALPHREATSPAWPERRETWVRGARACGVDLADDVADALASRHRLDAAAVRDVLDAAPAFDLATLSDLAGALVGTRPPSTRRTALRHGLDHLVLAPSTREALDRLVHYVARRDELSRAQGLGGRHRTEHGPLVLFAGRSGTGKTAAAEGVARALGRPMFTLDLSQLMSKYIGDTEKNVDEVLRAAEQTSGVLFCDEADALFSTRLERAGTAGEHFSNVLVGYLLQRIEEHEGVVVLATNLRHAIDEAFLRRFRFRIEFPLPTRAERERIWDLMLPPGVPRAPGLALGEVAGRDDISGGDIANAALRAIFLADRAGTPVTQGLLERAVALELMEQGRLSRPDPGDHPPLADRGVLLRAFVEAVQAHLRAELRARFLKEIHVVHGSPSEERLAGRRPAVSLTLLRLAAPRGNRGMRAGFVASAWSAYPEEEYELIGVVHEALVGLELTDVAGRAATVRLHESTDFDLLHKFWSSHDRPVQASVLLDVEIE
ncbi:ATP-binding protein [uncultured Cellulomonas sp.]|uniref:AAA family ATPase n=1 Tax=uncultured Cellulomonas sp. TaxID=189682 RepID=UPI0026047BF2|nr:ATP-binding protein [uncultured Cellulomonas sp.]